MLKTANCHMSLQRIVIFSWLVEGPASTLVAAGRSGWWLLKAGVAVTIS